MIEHGKSPHLYFEFSFDFPLLFFSTTHLNPEWDRTLQKFRSAYPPFSLSKLNLDLKSFFCSFCSYFQLVNWGTFLKRNDIWAMTWKTREFISRLGWGWEWNNKNILDKTKMYTGTSCTEIQRHLKGTWSKMVEGEGRNTGGGRHCVHGQCRGTLVGHTTEFGRSGWSHWLIKEQSDWVILRNVLEN